MRKKLALLTLSFTVLLAKAQLQIPKIILPSPEAFSMTKYGDLPIGLFTGTMNFSVPLMQIGSGKIQVPVSLDYATNGIKVDEVAGRVGLGWNLRAGGVISRNIIGKPDNGVNFSKPPTSDSTSWEFYNWVKNSATSDNFNMPDEFNYSFMGQSGKFYMNDLGEIKELSKSGIKFSVTPGMNLFQLVTPDGFQYEFGGPAKDSSSSERLGIGEAPSSFAASRSGFTAWYLIKITSPSGESVTFNYTAAGAIYPSGIQQSFTIAQPGVGIPVLFIQGSGCGHDGEMGYGPNGVEFQPAPCTVQAITTDIQQSSVAGVKLSEIISRQGKIRFYYSDREDITIEQKLDSIVLLSASGDKRLKKAEMQYHYSQSLAAYNTPENISWYPLGNTSLQVRYPMLTKRLYLDSVLFVDITGKEPHQSYGFSYDGRDSLPGRLSFAQDRFGFFNGKINSDFIPDNTYVNALIGGDISNTGKREVDTLFSRKGVLTRIKYPTGGFSKIRYESNQIAAATKSVYDTVVAEITNPAVNLTAVTPVFTPKAPVKLKVVTNWLGAPPPPDGPPVDTVVMVSIENAITNECVGICSIPVKAGETYIVYNSRLKYILGNLTSARIKLVSTHAALGARAELIEGEDLPFLHNKATGGVRVAAITNFTDEGIQSSYKRYTYEDPNYGVTSGALINDFQDIRDFAYFQWKVCGGGSDESYATQYVISSSSSMGGFSNDYLSVNYKFVTEYVDSVGGNGFTRYEFTISPNQLPSALTCVVPLTANLHVPFLIPGAPYSNTGALNGKEKTITVYRNNNGEYAKIKEARKFYSVDSRLYSQDRLFMVSQGVARSTYLTNYKYFADYYINVYKRISSWSHLDSTIEKEYDESGRPFTRKILYEYASPAHLQATSIKQYNSKGELLVSTKKYPHDIIANDVTTAMINRNMITAVLEEKTVTNDRPTHFQRNQYGFYNGVQLELAGVQTASFSNTLQQEYTINAYDSDGNITQITGRNGIPVTYLWDYTNSYPSAEIKNAMIGTAAYTSFEADSKGGWNYNAAGITGSSGGITGSAGFALGTYTIDKTISPGSNYIVTMWVKEETGTPSFNGSPGTKLITRKNWSLYKKEITGVSSISISGTGIIDELRLYPANARMTTFTYEPLIGMTSQCDANDKIQYYEYDGFGRLQIVRDADGNILKTLKYNYKQ